jgi:hypothetical protein
MTKTQEILKILSNADKPLANAAIYALCSSRVTPKNVSDITSKLTQEEKIVAQVSHVTKGNPIKVYSVIKETIKEPRTKAFSSLFAGACNYLDRGISPVELRGGWPAGVLCNFHEVRI